MSYAISRFPATELTVRAMPSRISRTSSHSDSVASRSRSLFAVPGQVKARGHSLSRWVSQTPLSPACSASMASKSRSVTSVTTRLRRWRASMKPALRWRSLSEDTSCRMVPYFDHFIAAESLYVRRCHERAPKYVTPARRSTHRTATSVFRRFVIVRVWMHECLEVELELLDHRLTV